MAESEEEICTTLMAESEEEITSWWKWKRRVKKVGLKLNIQKTEIMAPGSVSSVQFSSVAQSDSLRPGLPVHHQLPKFTQTHVHWVRDAIQPSHLLSSPSSPAFNLSQHPGSFQMSQLFASGGQNIRLSASTSVLPMNTQNWFPLGLTGFISLLSKGIS